MKCRMSDLHNKAHESDALEFCRKLPDNCIDHIVTDPPYNIGFAEWDKFLNIPELTREWFRILKPGGSVFCFAGWSFVCEVIKQFHGEFTLNDWIIYDRIKGRGAKKRLVSTREDLLWYVKSDSWVFNKNEAYSTIRKMGSGMIKKNGRDTRAVSNVWTDISPIVPWCEEHCDHETQKPVSLMERIVTIFTNPGDIILDCFCGSGPTGEASIKHGRIPILVDKNPKWVDYSNMRMERTEFNVSKKLF